MSAANQNVVSEKCRFRLETTNNGAGLGCRGGAADNIEQQVCCKLTKMRKSNLLFSLWFHPIKGNDKYSNVVKAWGVHLLVCSRLKLYMVHTMIKTSPNLGSFPCLHVFPPGMCDACWNDPFKKNHPSCCRSPWNRRLFVGAGSS